MFLSEPAETPFDLRFWLFGTHVRVHPWFWLLSAALGWGWSRIGLLYLGLWVLCVFVSVLIHEFGHIFMGRLFGSHGHIVLHSFGGLAIGASALNRGWQRFLVFFAGPLIQLVLFGGVLVAYFLLLPKVPASWYDPAEATLYMLWEINLFWRSSTSCRSGPWTAAKWRARCSSPRRRAGVRDCPGGVRRRRGTGGLSVRVSHGFGPVRGPTEGLAGAAILHGHLLRSLLRPEHHGHPGRERPAATL